MARVRLLRMQRQLAAHVRDAPVRSGHRAVRRVHRSEHPPEWWCAVIAHEAVPHTWGMVLGRPDRNAAPTAPRTRSATVSALGSIVPVLRDQTCDILAGWGLDPDGEVMYRMELAVSELSANAIIHGPQREGALIHITWSVHPGPPGVGFAAVTVTDAGDGSVLAVTPNPGSLSEHHRGLTLLVGMGVRVQPITLADGHRVTAWTPTDPQVAVCGCACWEHGYDVRWPDGSRVVCGGLLRDGAALIGERHGIPVKGCAACAYASRTNMALPALIGAQ